MDVLILQGAAVDNPTGEAIEKVLATLGITSARHICSAHRTPHRIPELIEKHEREGGKVMVGIAGLAAHLAGVMAAHSLLPVIGVPGLGGPLNGEDALLATVQMPRGIPVATVGIGNGTNAGWLAARIIALSNSDVADKLRTARAEETQKILEQDRELQESARSS